MQRFRLDYLQHAIRNRDIWTRIGPRSRLNIPVLYTWKGIPLDIAYFCFNNGDWWISMLTSRNYRGNDKKKEKYEISRLNMFKDWENCGGIYEVCEDKHVIA